tara:strand:+ start:189 stop:560 length:372 start_codon:yes stop_codon:yes gene_type:complete
MSTEKEMELNEIIFKTKIGDHFYVVTRYMGKEMWPEEPEEVDVYHCVAYREIIDGVGDYAGTRIAGIAGEVDIESCHLDLCAIYKKRLEKGGEWEGHDRPLKELYPAHMARLKSTKEKKQNSQ